MENKATAAQLQKLHALLYNKGLLNRKQEIVEGVSGGRVSSSKDLTREEIGDLLTSLDDYNTVQKDKKGPMIKKLFAMAHEMGWVEKRTVFQDGELVEKKDYGKVYEWVKKHGYKKTDLRRYTYKELPKLISVFEFKVYKPYLDKLRQNH